MFSFKLIGSALHVFLVNVQVSSFSLSVNNDTSLARNGPAPKPHLSLIILTNVDVGYANEKMQVQVSRIRWSRIKLLTLLSSNNDIRSGPKAEC